MDDRPSSAAYGGFHPPDEGEEDRMGLRHSSSSSRGRSSWRDEHHPQYLASPRRGGGSLKATHTSASGFGFDEDEKDKEKKKKNGLSAWGSYDDPLANPYSDDSHHGSLDERPSLRAPGAVSIPGDGGSSGYSFDAVAAKVEEYDNPRPESPASSPSPLEQLYNPRSSRFQEPESPRREQSSSKSNTEIEIAPGTFARLRGAGETMRAIEMDYYMPALCFACAQDIFCIQDASYVLCPKCRVVSPMEGADPAHNGGVGLGFTMEDLCQWQNEIMSKRSNHR